LNCVTAIGYLARSALQNHSVRWPRLPWRPESGRLRVGYFRRRVTLRRHGQETDLAVYEPKGWGSEGELQFAGGRIYAWKPANFWTTKFNFVDTAGKALVAFKAGAEESNWSDLFKFQALVEIDPSASRLEELPLLVSVGWYLMILHHEDASSAGAVVVTMG
jgi:hypothetical protein